MDGGYIYVVYGPKVYLYKIHTYKSMKNKNIPALTINSKDSKLKQKYYVFESHFWAATCQYVIFQLPKSTYIFIQIPQGYICIYNVLVTYHVPIISRKKLVSKISKVHSSNQNFLPEINTFGCPLERH